MKQIFTLIICLAFFNFGFSQMRGGKMHERIKTQKVAFITEKLSLTTEEAQQFWPIYNEFDQKTHDLKRQDLRKIKEGMRKSDLSDAEAEDLLNQFMAVEDKLHEAKKQLAADLMGILPARKIIQLKVAEDAFNRRLVEMLRERRQNNMKKNKP